MLLAEQFVVVSDYTSPGGIDYYTPKTNEDVKPKVDDIYDTYDAAVEMYKNYAFQAGFDIRLGSNKKKTDGTFTSRYLLCNREGKPNTGNVDTIDIQYKKIKQRKDMHRTECEVHIVFKLLPQTGKYVVHEFVERHNYMLIPKANMHLSRAKSKIDLSQQTYIYNMSKNNVGAKKAYRLMCGLQGGCSVRGGLAIDYKNCARNLNCFICGSDAQLIVNIMEERVKYAPNFSFEFRVEEKKLFSMFWADETSKYNYKEFGDVVSFDATYQTNRYSMLTWEIANNSDFKKRFNSLIWNAKINELEFEAGWDSMITEFHLEDNTWLRKMFGLRRLWIPEFFKNVPLSVVTDSSYGVDMFDVLERKKSVSTRTKEVVPDQPEEEEYHFDSLVKDKDFKVTHNKSEGSFMCTCMHFEHVGVLCRHIFSVMSHDPVKLHEYLEEINKLKMKYCLSSSSDNLVNRNHFEQIIGVTLQKEREIDNPSIINNKGSGTHGKRLKSKKEMFTINVINQRECVTHAKRRHHLATQVYFSMDHNDQEDSSLSALLVH
uniref:SWIM-type domain-containing protein n=1 Tax=Lactuca sativa TaxID=4236 RepID=A0A9R1VTA4_LACSA|nr:hypothetical protein LSAT_V11C400226650 [Lactuca sativa]